ncbi:MAG: DUF5606 domain-containing protein [Chitinophagales bacterium]|nr:DUF5606 domain-containing protein [Chitinophagales bacterium]
MTFKEIVAVSGMAGLKRIIAQRNDGLILADMDGENKKFYSNRIHLFSPLENISIYTEEDSTPLLDVMLEMKNQQETNPPVEPNSDPEKLRGYLAQILPDFDRDKVQISDIKKLIKWYQLLEPSGVIVKPEEKPSEESIENE